MVLNDNINNNNKYNDNNNNGNNNNNNDNNKSNNDSENYSNKNNNNKHNSDQQKIDSKEELDNFNKDIEELKSKLLEQEEKTNDYIELSKKIQADFENYKKRNYKENEQIVFLEKRNILIEFLNFRNTLTLAISNENDKKSSENLNQLLLNFDNILKRLNIKKIDCLNKEFDYNYSECVCKKKVEDKNKNNKVIEIIDDGYLLNNNLIKPAKVVVGYKEE
jgi:molecular chaperone GrpE